MDTDDFLAHGLDSDDDSDTTPTPTKPKAAKGKKKGKDMKQKKPSLENSPKQDEKKKKKKKKQKGKQDEVTEEKSTEEAAAPKGKEGKATKHKISLDKLKDQDPEFYEFLKNEDQTLLDFNPDESSDEGEGDEEEDMDAESDLSSDDEGGTHEFPSKLEVMTDSEESESEEEGEKKEEKPKQVTKVTIKMINQWSKALQESNSSAALHEVIAAFKGAVDQSSPDETSAAKYKVEGSTVFNAIVRVCLIQIPPTLEQILAVPKPTKEGRKLPLPSTSNKWKRVRMMVKSYIGDLMQLLSNMAEAEIMNVLLKHVHVMVPYYACFPKLLRVLMRKLISSWSTGEETSRVLAFLAINKMLRLQQDQLLDFTIKQMYMAYVRNCKFTSPTTLPLITFMQRSLVEVLAIDVQLTYQYAFIYIRQLAIHLRNAITTHKKDQTQAVYNWQYIHSLHLWARLLSQLHPNPTLQPLIYPLTQTIIGAIKLVPTAKFYPLRFHCCKALNVLSESTGTYIPVLPFLVEILELTDFNKRHKNISFKPLNFACILKLSKAQLHEKSFRDGVIDQLYEHILESFHIYAHTIAFPELALPPLLQIKKFLKQCKVGNYAKQLRQIVEKVEETSKVITQRRKTAAIDLKKPETVVAWEQRSTEEGTPLSKYYSTWRKMRTREQQHEIAGKDKASINPLPDIAKKAGRRTASDKERKEFKGLFETDSEDSETDEDEDDDRFKMKDERPKKKKKVEEDSDDDLSDFDEADLDKLAQSASEDEHEGSEEGDAFNADEEDDEDDEDDVDTGDIVEDFKFSDEDD